MNIHTSRIQKYIPGQTSNFDVEGFTHIHIIYTYNTALQAVTTPRKYYLQSNTFDS
jgi:hypothetical protein